MFQVTDSITHMTIFAFWAPNSCHHATSYPCTSFEAQARAKIQVAKNWNNRCYPEGNIASLLWHSLLRLLCLHRCHRLGAAFFAPFFAMLLIAGDRKRNLGNASVTQDKLLWTRQYPVQGNPWLRFWLNITAASWDVMFQVTCNCITHTHTHTTMLPCHVRQSPSSGDRSGGWVGARWVGWDWGGGGSVCFNTYCIFFIFNISWAWKLRS